MLKNLSRVEVAERMTSAEFFRYAPEDQKAELIEGVMIVSPPPSDKHARLQLFLVRLLGEFVERNELGEVRGSRTAVELAEDQTFEPDLLFIARERDEILTDKGVFGPPDLVIEILSYSSAKHDRETKLREYDRAGVKEVWLIDPYGPVCTEFYQQRGDRLKPVMPSEDGVLLSTALPGFQLKVEWLWPAERFIAVRKAMKEMGVE